MATNPENADEYTHGCGGRSVRRCNSAGIRERGVSTRKRAYGVVQRVEAAFQREDRVQPTAGIFGAAQAEPKQALDTERCPAACAAGVHVVRQDDAASSGEPYGVALLCACPLLMHRERPRRQGFFHDFNLDSA